MNAAALAASASAGNPISRVRVLHAHSGNLFGGVESFLLTWLRRPEACPRLELLFALCFEGRFHEELVRSGAEMQLLPPVRFRWPPTIWHARSALRQMLAATRPRVGVCHSPWAMAVFGRVLRQAGCRVVFWVHDILDGRHWLQRLACRIQPDLVIHNSRFTEISAKTLYPNVSRALVYCPVEMPGKLPEGTRCQVRTELQTPEDAVVVVQVGRLEPWKGHGDLFAALGLMRSPQPVWLWVVGGAQRPAEQLYLDRLKQLAGSLGLRDRIRFLGARSDVPRLLQAADIFCQPNAEPEPFGIVFVEALHASLPVIATRMGGAMEIVNDECGVLVAPRDTQALAGVLAELATHPARRHALGREGPARAKALCDPDRQISEIQRLLLEISA